MTAFPAATDIEIVSRNMDDAFMALTAAPSDLQGANK
jgi:hypothetical protein